MNDPWDVKSVRQSGQYVSCMKINGVPLLPPVLSRECRKEMQYYKVLSREVEKRISLLKTYIDIDTDSSEDKTDAPDLPESEQSYELAQEEIQAGFNINIDKITAITNGNLHDKSFDSPPCSVKADHCNNVTITKPCTPTLSSPNKFVIDFSLSINETGQNVLQTGRNSPNLNSNSIDEPERDYDCTKTHNEKEFTTDVNSSSESKRPRSDYRDVVNFSFSVDKEILSDPFPDLSIKQDGPSSLTSKSFTGSLMDIHTESKKESQITPSLIRQRSYTLLKPSPHLLAHLEVQSLCTGIDVSCISMSESQSNLNTPTKKRKSWDLETAKVKWSSMALELSQKNMTVNTNGAIKNSSAKLATRKFQSASPPRSRSVLQEKLRRPNNTIKMSPKSEPVQKLNKKSMSPVRNVQSNRTITKESTPKTSTPKKENIPKSISEADDPALRVRELYEKIQKQQLVQMASLVEKQKREQLLLQQVFEEQNNLLYKQLKTICPKSPIEAKEAWLEKNIDNTDRGPVSLSQLINHKSPEQTDFDSPLSSTLTETNNYINHCDDILKRSKDITSCIKKQPIRTQSVSNGKIATPKPNLEGSRTRTHSPTNRNTSRRLNYDTSASSERNHHASSEFEPILTDRTNDTMADLNVTFPTDQSDECQSPRINDTVINQRIGKDVTVIRRSPTLSTRVHCSTPDKKLEHGVQKTANIGHPTNSTFICQPTPQQRAAATKLVAYARGFLVRRLLRTERVQATVQTIRDALLCALQLHQDREGIRGADVDLHRRLIQQITAACYALHDTFISSSPGERCAIIAADRARKHALAAKPPSARLGRQDIMSQSYSGAFPARSKKPSSASLMTQSNYETFSESKPCYSSSRRYMQSPRRRPWR